MPHSKSNIQNSKSLPLPIQNSKSNIQNSASGSSYGQILRSSYIIGGATGINYVIGMTLSYQS